jgi:hypothetical protein
MKKRKHSLEDIVFEFVWTVVNALIASMLPGKEILSRLVWSG